MSIDENIISNNSLNKETDINNKNNTLNNNTSYNEYHNKSAIINSNRNNYNNILNKKGGINDIGLNKINNISFNIPLNSNKYKNKITSKSTLSDNDIDMYELEEKANNIITIINKAISKLNLDPILCSMKKEPMLSEFYKNRILEIISEKLNNEQELMISKLKKQNNQINKELLILSKKLEEINKYTAEEKEKIFINIKNLENELELKNDNNNKLLEQIESMNNDINLKNQQIIFYQNNIENIKIKQDEM